MPICWPCASLQPYRIDGTRRHGVSSNSLRIAEPLGRGIHHDLTHRDPTQERRRLALRQEHPPIPAQQRTTTHTLAGLGFAPDREQKSSAQSKKTPLITRDDSPCQNRAWFRTWPTHPLTNMWNNSMEETMGNLFPYVCVLLPALASLCFLFGVEIWPRILNSKFLNTAAEVEWTKELVMHSAYYGTVSSARYQKGRPRNHRHPGGCLVRIFYVSLPCAQRPAGGTRRPRTQKQPPQKRWYDPLSDSL